MEDEFPVTIGIIILMLSGFFVGLVCGYTIGRDKAKKEPVYLAVECVEESSIKVIDYAEELSKLEEGDYEKRNR